MLPIPTDPAELDAIRTADQFGYLMPSHVGTPQAERLIAAGYAAYDPEVPGWPKLVTAARRTSEVSMNTDWREAARGIPVWEGSRVCRIGLRGVGTVQAILPGGGGLTLWGDGATLDPREFFPNLADPDTRAAYDRRLALALGCPEEAANDGIAVGLRGGFFAVGAGGMGPTWASKPIQVDTADPLLARALAWPADKRVKG